MSTATALQNVTSALRNRLRTVVPTRRVETLPPHLVKIGLGASPFLNLFLFEVLPNAAWRNQELPARGGSTLRPPLPLDLRYLLTAFPDADDEGPAHALLGQAMLVLHDNPVLSRVELAGARAPGEPSSGLEVQFEQVKTSLMHLPLEELSKLWTAFGTGYRLSVVYQLSVVLLDPTTPPDAPLPVLQRGSADPNADEPPAVGVGAGPVLEAVAVEAWLPRRSVPARHLDTVVVDGQALGAAEFLRFHHPGLAVALDAPVLTASARRVTAQVPAGVPVGFCTVAAGTDLGSGRALTSNRLPLAVAPRMTVAVVPPAAAPVPGVVTLDVTVDPAPAAGVPVLLLFGGLQLTGRPADPGHYRVDAPVPAAATAANPVRVPVRVRVEGVDSVPLPDPEPGEPLPLDWDDLQVVVLP